MVIIVCVDERRGMTFNGRRQSRDSKIYADIAENMAEGSRLLADEYSKPLFSELAINAEFRGDFLDVAEKGDVCFVEKGALLPYVKKAEKLIIYHWNRHYPSDTRLDIIPENIGFSLVATKEFEGNSHEKITKEIYGK